MHCPCASSVTKGYLYRSSSAVVVIGVVVSRWFTGVVFAGWLHVALCGIDCYDACAPHARWILTVGTNNAAAISGLETELMYRKTQSVAGPEMPKIPQGGGKRK